MKSYSIQTYLFISTTTTMYSNSYNPSINNGSVRQRHNMRKYGTPFGKIHTSHGARKYGMYPGSTLATGPSMLGSAAVGVTAGGVRQRHWMKKQQKYGGYNGFNAQPVFNNSRPSLFKTTAFGALGGAAITSTRQRHNLRKYGSVNRPVGAHRMRRSGRYQNGAATTGIRPFHIAPIVGLGLLGGAAYALFHKKNKFINVPTQITSTSISLQSREEHTDQYSSAKKHHCQTNTYDKTQVHVLNKSLLQNLVIEVISY